MSQCFNFESVIPYNPLMVFGYAAMFGSVQNNNMRPCIKSDHGRIRYYRGEIECVAKQDSESCKSTVD
jgi:hypothetical protein